MKDDKTTVNDLKVHLKNFVRERDWEQFHKPKDLAISLSLEANEVLELFQWKDKSLEELKNDPKFMVEIKDELSDCMSYILNLANYLEIDLSSSFENKIEKTSKKYPIEKWKGRAGKYTEDIEESN